MEYGASKIGILGMNSRTVKAGGFGELAVLKLGPLPLSLHAELHLLEASESAECPMIELCHLGKHHARFSDITNRLHPPYFKTRRSVNKLHLLKLGPNSARSP